MSKPSKIKIQPRVVKGTRDFLPEQVGKRNYLLDVIRSVFQRYGFQEIETPAIELLETLTGKYGDEGDKLLFKILNSGDYLDKVEPGLLENPDSRSLTSQIAEKGLRYDLTVPLARYVVQHQNEIVFPFRRFHIGPVWRADRPQRGRYREFYQCDADIIGSGAVLNEAELTQILLDAFDRLNIAVTIEINHRKILEGIVAAAGCLEQYKEVLTAIDKLDKAGKEAVTKEMKDNGIQDAAVEQLFELFGLTDLDELSSRLADHSSAIKGIEEIGQILGLVHHASVVFSPALARGLDYYTGTIWEVKANDVKMGTIAAGGRYDDLTEMFGGRDMSGVGISFGIERIYDILEETNGFPEYVGHTTRVLIIQFDEASMQAGWLLLQKLRSSGIPAELYPSAAKLKKQMSYADRKQIPFVIFLGEEELKAGKLTLKNMASGDQDSMTESEAIQRLSDAS